MTGSTTTMIPLREKFLGCVAGVHVGSAMAAPVECWTWQRIEEEYGTLDRFLPYHHYKETTDWVREPGTTEDGVERQKLMITAIMEKGDRVNAEDVRRIWVRDIKPESAGKISEPFEARLLELAKTQLPARHIGQYCDYSGLVSLARSCHPLGLINAGDPAHALEDVYEVGQLYAVPNSRAIQWAAVTAVGIAEATKPDATVDSVIGGILNWCDTRGEAHVKEAGVVQEIERALKRTEKCSDFRELREAFDGVYNGVGMPYCYSYANEVVTKAVCIFRMVKGNLKEAIVAGVNMGRDTDCVTAVSAGISGALSGSGSLPEEWIRQVDHATSLMSFSNSQRTIAEHADGLLGAYRSRMRRQAALAKEMGLLEG